MPFDTVVGGIANLCCGSTVTLTNSTVSGNSTTGTPSDAFGGILNSAPGDVVTLTNSTVSGNSASAPGGPGAFSIAVGGISNAGGSLTLTSSTLSGNSVNDLLPALAQGQIHVSGCSSNVFCFNFLNRRADLQIVADVQSAGRTERSIGATGLVVRQDLWENGTLSEPRDFVGHTIHLIVGPGSGSHG